MAIITVPSALKVRSANWRLSRPAQVNRSVYTGRRKVMSNPWHGRWAADVEIAALQIAEATTLRGFLAALKGQINTFRLEAATENQHAHTGTVDVLGGGQTGNTLITKGWPATGTYLLAGMMVTVGEQLLVLTADAAISSGGVRTLTFEPPLRVSPAGNEVVETRLPTALVALAEDTFGWSTDLGPIFSFGFSVEEAF